LSTLVRDFFAAVTAGDLPDSLLTPDMKGWTTTQGSMEKTQYQRLIRLLAKISARPLTFTIDSITAEQDRVVAEVRSLGILINGEEYRNTYVFVFRIRDGRIASVAEHFNALIVQEKMVPLVRAIAKTAGGWNPMRAMRLRQPASLDNIRLDTAVAPAPGPGEIRVRIRAASLNFRDNLVATGYFPAADGLIPLSDGAGEVEEIGEGVTQFKAGDAVVSTFHPAWLDGHVERSQLVATPGGRADGFACEFVTRPATHFTRAPQGLTLSESATLPCAGVTAWRALVADGCVKPGSRVLVQGTGGVSLFGLQFAKAAGATVIATSSTTEKLERLKALGADHVINYREVEKWGEAVLALTDGLGVDHVIEVGGPNTLAQSLTAARTGAHIAIIGAVAGFKIDTMPFAVVQAKRLRLQGVSVGSRRDQIDMIGAIEANGIRPVIDRSFPLEELANALRHQQTGQRFGKICIDI
jgi:NADPH:quinone reductase-like Zn-dependent oxidoreductase/ketosteroid isomerase-like protein